LWREYWKVSSIAHGSVLYADGRVLRLNPPFGPLQSMAVTVVWTISLEPYEGGTKVIFEEFASGSSVSGLDQVAKAMDHVKTKAIARLVGVTVSPDQ
jgi:hypothetical protein